MEVANRKKLDSNPKLLFEKIFKIGFYGLIVSFAISILLFIVLIYEDGYLGMSFCGKQECFVKLSKPLSFSYFLFKEYVEIIYMLSTAFGIFFAVRGYYFNKDSTNVYNHIELLRMFSSFVEDEVSKKEMLDIKSINSIKLYNYIFPESRYGKNFVVSNDFESMLVRLNDLIIENNKKIYNSNEDSFRYIDHQKEIAELLKGVGIYLDSYPRLVFNNLEKQLYELLNSILSEFSDSTYRIKISDIKYM